MKPPDPLLSRLARWMMKRMIDRGAHSSLLGDFEEIHAEIASEKGAALASRWAWAQVIKSLPSRIYNSFFWRAVMMKSYIKVAFRNLTRHKGYSFLNISGLALGMAAGILILFWVQDEYGFDRFHHESDRIYVVATEHLYGTRTSLSIGSPPALVPALKREYPEVTAGARIENGSAPMVIRYGDKALRENIQNGDADLFKVFSFPLIQGDSDNLFPDTHCLALSESAAERIFREDDPMGQTLSLENRFDFRVTGIFRDIPENSSLRFEILAPLEFTHELYENPDYTMTWSNCGFRGYVRLADGTDAEDLSRRIAGRIKASREGSNITPFVYPFSRLYLHGIRGRGGRIQQVRMFGLIALLILLIACINFMNLTTARSGSRAREVGMRKVVGARRFDLIRQFYGESLLMTLLALILGTGLARLFLPAFNGLSGKSLDFTGSIEPLAGIAGIAVAAGLLAGSYPALLLSAFKPVRVLKGKLPGGPRGSLFRKIMVVFQFSVSITLIIGTTVVFRQLNLLRDQDVGLEREHILYMPLTGSLPDITETVRREILGHPAVQAAGTATHIPTGVWWNGSGWKWEGKSEDVDPFVTYMAVDEGFPDVFGIEMAEGRFFSTVSRPGTRNIVINQSFARVIGKESLVGMPLLAEDSDGSRLHFPIIGVVEDFHYKPLTYTIGPLLIYYKPDFFPMRYIFGRTSPGRTREAVAHFEDVHRRLNPDFPFLYSFLDEDYDRLYSRQDRLGRIIRTFAFLAVLISCLGLFGMASFTAQQRTKEIGIRKVLGASSGRIVWQLTRQFSRWVLTANLIAWPAAWFLMNDWLRGYPYRTGLGAPLFLLAAGGTLGIALLTVGWQAVRAAIRNPVESLRYE